jgi:hypothetical protein
MASGGILAARFVSEHPFAAGAGHDVSRGSMSTAHLSSLRAVD